MAKRTGGADLPLHGGRVPEWLAERMAGLGRVIVEALVLEYGRDEVLRRLAHPFWFQSLGALMGMDWHSSGVTTSVLGALRRGLAPVAAELGLHVLSGRGAALGELPGRVVASAERLGLDGRGLARASRLALRVDDAALQDGFHLYLQGLIFTPEGGWVAIQQGLSASRGRARRYHWASEGLESFVDAPHAAIVGAPEAAPVVNLADVRAERARAESLALARSGHAELRDAVVAARRAARGSAAEERLLAARVPHLHLPDAHEVGVEQVNERSLARTLTAVHAAAPSTFEELLLTGGLGRRTLATLAFVAEVLHGAPSRFTDPARFSLALGGKDGHPFPVPTRVYDDTLRVLKKAIANARLGRGETLSALGRLDAEVRRVEVADGRGALEAWVSEERARSSALCGRAVGSGGRGSPYGAPFDRQPRRGEIRAPSAPAASRRGPFF